MGPRPLSRTLVEIPARLRELDPERPVTVLSAPAGFGKTTVMETWLARAGGRQHLVKLGELLSPENSLDSGQALLQAAVAVGADASRADAIADLITPDGTSFGEEFLRGLAALLADVPGPLRVFLDDLHLLTDSQLAELGPLLVHVADADHRFVVASRELPPWPIQRWRVAGFAAIVTATELRLSVDESAEVLADDFGERREQVARLSGGWPAALQVMRWHAQKDPRRFFDSVVGDVTDYVIAEIIPSLPPDELNVLSDVSVLEPFPMEVGVAVADDPAARQILRDVTRRTALVEQAANGLVTIHLTVKAALLEALRSREPEREASLHVRAGEAWLAQPPTSQTLISAIDHFVAGRAWQRALETISGRWAELETASRLDLFVGWLDKVPAEYWQSDHELAPLYVLANLREGHTIAARTAARQIAGRADRVTNAVVGLSFASSVGWDVDPDEAVALCERDHDAFGALDEDRGSPRFAAFAGVTSYQMAVDISLGQAQAMQGRFVEAADTFRGLLPRSSQVSPLTQIVIWGGLGADLAMMGELSEATSWLDAALALAQELNCSYHLRTCPAQFGRSVATAFGGDRAGALRLVEQTAIPCRASRALNFLHLCDVAASICHVEERFVASTDPPLAARPLPLATQFLAANGARDDSRHGRHVNATVRLQGLVPHELLVGTWTEVSIAARGRTAAARWLSTVAPPRSASARLVRMLSEAATVESATQAREIAEEAAQFADATHLWGLLADAPRQLWQRSGVTDSSDPLLLGAVERVKAELLDDDRPRLTDREYDLLRLLPLELNLADLADRLFLSVHTLKWHRANLYRKLGVRRRDAAVAQAIELGLLPPNA